MAVARYSTITDAANDASAVTSITTELTAGGSNRAILVLLQLDPDNTTPSNLVVRWYYNGSSYQTLTLIEAWNSGGVYFYLYGLIGANASSGSPYVSASWSGSSWPLIYAQSLTGVLQTSVATAFTNATHASGTSSSAAVTIASATGDMVFAHHNSDYGEISAIQDSTLFSIIGWYDDRGGGPWSSAGNYANGASSVTLNVSINNTAWRSQGVNVVQASAAQSGSALLIGAGSFVASNFGLLLPAASSFAGSSNLVASAQLILSLTREHVPYQNQWQTTYQATLSGTTEVNFIETTDVGLHDIYDFVDYLGVLPAGLYRWSIEFKGTVSDPRGLGFYLVDSNGGAWDRSTALNIAYDGSLITIWDGDPYIYITWFQVTSLGSGWYRVEADITLSELNDEPALVLRLLDSSGNGSYTGDGSSGVTFRYASLYQYLALTANSSLVAAGQLQAIAVPQPLIGTATLAASALLIEQARSLLVGTGAFQSAATALYRASASLLATGKLVVNANRYTPAIATLSGVTTFKSSAILSAAGSTLLTGTSELFADAAVLAGLQPVSGASYYFKTGNDAATTDATGYTAVDNRLIGVSRISTLLSAAAKLQGASSLDVTFLHIHRITDTTWSGESTLLATASLVDTYASTLVYGDGVLTASASLVSQASTLVYGDGVLTSSTHLTTQASALISGDGVLQASAWKLTTGDALLVGSGLLSSSALRRAVAAAQLVGTGALVAAETQRHVAAATLIGIGELTAEAYGTTYGVAILDGVGAFDAAAYSLVPGEALLAGDSTLDAAAILYEAASALFGGESSLYAEYLTAGTWFGAADFSGVGVLSTSATLIEQTSALLIGDSTATASALLLARGDALLTASGALTSSSAAWRPASALLTGDSTATAAALLLTSGSALFAGTGLLTASASSLQPGEALTFAATGTLTAHATAVVAAAAALSGDGTFAGEARLTLPASALLDGVGALTVATVGTQPGEARFDGAGIVTVEALQHHTARARLDGVSDLAALAIQLQQAAARFAGAGRLLADSAQQGRTYGEALIEGVGDLQADSILWAQAHARYVGVGGLTAAASMTWHGNAIFRGTTALLARAGINRPTAAHLDGASGLRAAGRLVLPVAAAFAGVGTLRSTGRLRVQIGAHFEASTVLNPVFARLRLPAKAALLATGDFDAAAILRQRGRARFAGLGGISATAAQIMRARPTRWAADGGLSADAGLWVYRMAARLQGRGSLLWSSAQTVVAASTLLVGSGEVSARANTLLATSASWAGSGGLSAHLYWPASAAAALVGTGDLRAATWQRHTFRRTAEDITLPGQSGINATAVLTAHVGKLRTLMAAGGLDADARQVTAAWALLNGSGRLLAGLGQVSAAEAVLVGAGHLVADARHTPFGAALFSGDGGWIAATARLLMPVHGRIAGEGSLQAEAKLVLTGRARMSGVGGWAAQEPNFIRSARARFAGSSRVRAIPQHFAQVSAIFRGDGGLRADLVMRGVHLYPDIVIADREVVHARGRGEQHTVVAGMETISVKARRSTAPATAVAKRSKYTAKGRSDIKRD